MKVLHLEARPPVVGLCLLWRPSRVVSKYVEQNGWKFMDLSLLYDYSLCPSFLIISNQNCCFPYQLSLKINIAYFS